MIEKGGALDAMWEVSAKVMAAVKIRTVQSSPFQAKFVVEGAP